MTSGKNGEMTLMFESVVVQDANSSTTKEFSDVSIELSGKEIYIGSNYKLKWKHITSLRCKNDVDDADEDEDEDGNKNGNARSLQEYRDADYERAGFELTCVRDAKKKSKTKDMSFRRLEDANPDNNNDDELRRFSVSFPIPPDGQRSVGMFWERFCKLLQGGYKKELHKRQKKKDKERAKREEELHEQELRRKSYSRNRSTYSKRPYDFMRKNAANIAHNAEVWTDDEEEAPRESPARESTPELVPTDEETEDAGAVLGINDNDDDDESENEFQDGFGEGKQDHKIDTDNSVGASGEEDRASVVEGENKNDEEDFMEKSPPEELDDEDEENLPMNRPTKTSQSSKGRRIKRRGPVLEDSEDEDDNLFQNDALEMTTTGLTAQRVVTPATAKATVNTLLKNRAPRFLEDEEDEGYDDGKNQEKGHQLTDETDEEESVKTNQKINAFFQPRSKTNRTMKGKNPNSITDDSMSAAAATPAKKKHQSGDMDTSDGDKNENVANVSDGNHETKQSTIDSKSKNSFFAPKSKASLIRQKTKTPSKTPTRIMSPKKKKRTPTTTKSLIDNDLSDSDETSTIVAKVDNSNTDRASLTPSRSPFLRAHSPKQRRMHFDIVRSSESQKHDGMMSIEEEDPIENPDSSQSQSPLKKLSSSSLKRSANTSSGRGISSTIKRRRLRINGSRSALEALEFADAKAEQHRSPVSITRSNRDAIKVANIAVGARSPIQPLKLGPQVEMAATELPKKWRGLRNDGNSCYVNSSLQQLFSVPNFMGELAKRDKGNELTATLSKLCTDLLDTEDKEAPKVSSARPVKKVMDRLTNRFHGHQQRDAHEFLGELIDQIHEELSPPLTGKEGEDKESENDSAAQDSVPRDITPTDDFFRWNVQVCLKCKSCGYSRSKEEMYRYLSIDIGHNNAGPRDPGFVKPAVDSCLANFFAPEDREVNCEKCKVGKIATQTMKILSVPKVILLHLKRFIVVEKPIAGSEETELVFKKNKVPVELTTDLSLGKLLNNNQSTQSPGTPSKLPLDEYRLKSIVHHIGISANSGHYTTDALRADPEGGKDQWVSFDDGVVVEKSANNVVESPKNQKTAYMLLYSRE